jgi:hypothetical protein
MGSRRSQAQHPIPPPRPDTHPCRGESALRASAPSPTLHRGKSAVMARLRVARERHSGAMFGRVFDRRLPIRPRSGIGSSPSGALRSPMTGVTSRTCRRAAHRPPRFAPPLPRPPAS